MKHCSSCNLSKPLDAFNKKGTNKFQPFCRECQRIRAKEHYRANKEKATERRQRGQKNRRAAFEEFKTTLHCNRCPETDIAVLDFHHTDPATKEKNIASIAGAWSIDRIKEEAAKCEVLCSNCHRRHHYYQNR